MSIRISGSTAAPSADRRRDALGRDDSLAGFTDFARRRFPSTQICSSAAWCGRGGVDSASDSEQPVKAKWSLTRDPVIKLALPTAPRGDPPLPAPPADGHQRNRPPRPYSLLAGLLDPESKTRHSGRPSRLCDRRPEGAYTTGPIAALQAAIRSGRLGEARNTLMPRLAQASLLLSPIPADAALSVARR
jgi:hypothetical protein